MGFGETRKEREMLNKAVLCRLSCSKVESCDIQWRLADFTELTGMGKSMDYCMSAANQSNVLKQQTGMG